MAGINPRQLFRHFPGLAQAPLGRSINYSYNVRTPRLNLLVRGMGDGGIAETEIEVVEG